MVHLDYFSGSVADLKGKDKKDPLKVLAVLAKDPMVSVWDMDKLWKILYSLRDQGLVEEVEHPYPWLEFRVTEKGKRGIVE